jgi:hypothetical protein
VPAHRAASQAAPDSATPVGVWRGTSSCLVRPSPCHDEIVVYRITRMSASDSLSLDARKIIDAREVEMGVLACRLSTPTASLTCPIPSGVWRFTVRGDSLVGELRLADGTRFRDVRTARSP